MKTIIGYPNYKISEDGKVFNAKFYKYLKPQTDSSGYFHVSLLNSGKSKTFRIHKLVAIYYLGHIPNGFKNVIDHIDNNKLNNHYMNLQLVTARINTSKNRLKRNNISKSLGVYFLEKTGKWKSTIYNKKSIHLGYFNTEEEASLAYKKEFEILNRE